MAISHGTPDEVIVISPYKQMCANTKTPTLLKTDVMEVIWVHSLLQRTIADVEHWLSLERAISCGCQLSWRRFDPMPRTYKCHYRLYRNGQ